MLLMHSAFGSDIQLLLNQGDLESAEVRIQAKLAQTDLSVSEEITYLGYYGEVWFYRHNMPKARAYYLEALSVAEHYDLSRYIAEHSKNIAITHSEEKRFGEALAWHESATQALDGDLNNNIGLSVLLSQGIIYAYIGAPELAFETLSRASNLAYELKNDIGLNNALIRFAKLNYVNRDYQLSAQVLADVNPDGIQQMDNLSWYLALSMMVSMELEDMAQLDDLIKLYETYAVEWPVEVKNRFTGLLIEYNIMRGELNRAQTAIDDYKDRMTHEPSWYIEMIQASLHKKNHQHIKALDAYRKAIEIFHLSGEQAGAGEFVAVPVHLFEQAIDAALDVSSQNHDEILSWLSELYSAKHPLFFQGSREQQPVASESELSAGKGEVFTDVLLAQGQRNTISTATIRKNLDAETAVVFYLSFNQQLMALLISKKQIHFERIYTQFSHVEDKISQMLLQMTQDDDDWLESSKQLYDILIQPLVLQGIEQHQALWIVPDENLRLLPFDILLDPEGQLMADKYRISNQSINTIEKIINKKQRDVDHTSSVRLSLVGRMQEVMNMPQHWRTAYRNLLAENAEFKGFDQEVKFIQSLQQNGAVLLNDAATESSTKSLIAEEQGILHVASHGFDNPLAPAFSALLLKSDAAADGLLQAREVAQMQTDLDMVVLASCSSAKGGFKGRYGHQLGLAEAFVSAGATTVIGTLWDVKDQKTAQFMQWFYRSLHSGQTASQALYDAKQEAIRQHWNAYDWSGFTLTGDGRNRFTFANTSDGLLFVWLLAGLMVVFLAGWLLMRRRLTNQSSTEPA